MFAHQVIDSLKEFDRHKNFLRNGVILESIKEIRNSQHFHFGDASNYRDYLIKQSGKLIDFKSFYPPYHKCWLDWTFYDTSNPDINQTKCTKRSALLIEKGGLLFFRFFFYFDVINRWVFWPYLYIARKNGGFGSLKKETYDQMVKYHVELNGIGRNIPEFKVDMENNLITVPLFTNDLKYFDAQRMHCEVAEDFSFIATFLEFLNCKNIDTVKNLPPKALNKKRVKSCKQPLFTYKTLVIKPTGKKQEAQAAQGLWDNRVHLCRGHFKTYTDANPLFGRVTGRFWWQPAVRGDKEKGVVMKDYKVEV